MSSRYRHRRTPLASTPFPSPVEPGEIVVNTANRQIAVGDASAGTLGQPKQLIAVRFFDVTAAYVLNDLVVQAGKVYRANGNIPPGAFNATNWTDLGGSATAALVTFAPGGNVSSTNVQAAIAEVDAEKVAIAGDTMTGHLTLPSGPAATNAVRKDYVDAADANLAASMQAGFDAQTTAVAAKVAKAGDTMTGNLIVKGTNPMVAVDKSAAGNSATIVGQTADKTRWALFLGETSPESGGNAGSDFAIGRYNDAGVIVDAPFVIRRDTGLMTVGFDPVTPYGVATKQYVDGKTAVATAAEYIANSAPTKMLTPGAVWSAVNAILLTDAPTVTPDFSAGLDFVWTLGGTGRTLANPTNLKGGQKGLIYLYQNVAGSTITTWGSFWKFPGGVKPVLSTAFGSFDVLSYVVYPNNTNFIFCTFNGSFL